MKKLWRRSLILMQLTILTLTTSGEEVRYDLIGLLSRRLLFVVYTQSEEDVIRLISARKAEKKHRRIYA